MDIKRIIGTVTAAVAITAAAVLYTIHPVKSSDHQDTFNLATGVGHNPSADITDVYVFPSPTDPANKVVFAMDVWPLINPTQLATSFFDPTIIWQFKIAHGATNYQEDQVIQLGVSGVDANQKITLYGPAAPNEPGTTNTLVASTGSFGFNAPATVGSGANAIQVFAGPRADPFRFDLFAFFSFLGDRAFDAHTAQNDGNGRLPLYSEPQQTQPQSLGNKFATPQTIAQSPTNPSFAGFTNGTTTAGTTSALGNYACNAGPAQNFADIGPFNVLSYVVEVPKSLIYGPGTPFSSSVIHVWATANSSTTTN